MHMLNIFVSYFLSLWYADWGLNLKHCLLLRLEQCNIYKKTAMNFKNDIEWNETAGINL